MGVDDWRQIKDVDAALQKIRDTKDFWINLNQLQMQKIYFLLLKK